MAGGCTEFWLIDTKNGIRGQCGTITPEWAARALRDSINRHGTLFPLPGDCMKKADISRGRSGLRVEETARIQVKC